MRNNIKKDGTDALMAAPISLPPTDLDTGVGSIGPVAVDASQYEDCDNRATCNDGRNPFLRIYASPEREVRTPPHGKGLLLAMAGVSVLAYQPAHGWMYLGGASLPATRDWTCLSSRSLPPVLLVLNWL